MQGCSRKKGMNDAYILELIFENEFGNKQYMYFGHDRFQLYDFPTHRSLMELNSAKAKRTKVLKDFKQGHWKGLKDIKIRRVHLRICEELEMDESCENIFPKIVLPEGSEEKLDKIIEETKAKIDEQERILKG